VSKVYGQAIPATPVIVGAMEFWQKAIEGRVAALEEEIKSMKFDIERLQWPED
jgi:hypothetical protein